MTCGFGLMIPIQMSLPDFIANLKQLKRAPINSNFVPLFMAIALLIRIAVAPQAATLEVIQSDLTFIPMVTG